MFIGNPSTHTPPGAPKHQGAGARPPARGSPIRLDESNSWPGFPGHRFNPSILADGDGYLFAFRNRWLESDVVVGRLDVGFRPIGAASRLALEHPDADRSREDPRLFRFRSRPHLAFTGHKHGERSPSHNQLYARLSADGMAAEEVFAPHYPGRQRWEKNWSFFEHGGEFYAVYSFAPCRVLRVAGAAAALAFETPTASIWRGGEIRGGPPPVLVGDELWCFTHDHVMARICRQYRTGLVALDAHPPFAARRMVAEPILVAERATKPPTHHAYVVFAGGAVRHGDDWIVAHGIHDHWSELHVFRHADLESRLVHVG
jgi:predicted GH43/DUF377 family glycosyl hydrolase